MGIVYSPSASGASASKSGSLELSCLSGAVIAFMAVGMFGSVSAWMYSEEVEEGVGICGGDVKRWNDFLL